MMRTDEIAAFLAANGWGGARRAPLAGDASARRYERLRRGFSRAILMDMPPASGLDVRPFLAVTAWLRAGGFSAPEVLAADGGAGLVLLEDLGDVELWHADLYRLGGAGELAELGLEEAFAEAICLVEWADRLGPALPARRLMLALDFVPGEDEVRVAGIDAEGEGWDWLPAVAAEVSQ